MSKLLKIKVKCVCCGYKKEVGEEQREMPMCDKCFSPMIVEKVIRKTLIRCGGGG